MNRATDSVTTVVLTSRRNFVWHSMQEIIPSIESLWRLSAVEGHAVHVVDVDEITLPALVPVWMKAQNIVLACFTPKIAQLARIARTELGIDARLLIYLHNQATVACWPFRHFGLGDALDSDDVFISSSRPDADALRNAIENARVEVIPFTLPEENSVATGQATGPRHDFVPEFAFIGRISPQKNLHTLLCALKLLADRNSQIPWKLDLFGGEDHLGSPNMGIEVPGYENYLKNLMHRLGLEKSVTFHGFLPRNELNRRLEEREYVFVSPSLHADENFGMATLRSLCLGHAAALSRWGGHADFEANFPGKVHYAPAHGSPFGPFLRVNELSEAMSRAAFLMPNPMDRGAGLPTPYRPEVLAGKLRSLATLARGKSEPLIFTRLADQILENRRRYLKDSERGCKIFDSYADPLAQPFFKSYGMTDSEPDSRPAREITLYPWVSVEKARARIDDPHRGSFELTDTTEEHATVLALGMDGRRNEIGRSLAEALVNHGFGDWEGGK